MSPIQTAASAREELRDRIVAIERDIDAGRYFPGPWETLLRDARSIPRVERAPLADEISRVSRKLHTGSGRYTVPFMTALLGEIVFAIAGGVLLLIATGRHSNILAIIAALIWIAAFQPLVKIGVGYMLGVDYEYAYFYGVEPRFKMRHGDYIAAPRWGRIVLHLSGMVGSPLGAWLPTICLSQDMWPALDFCWIAFWIVVAINLASLLAAMAGVRRIGPLKLSMSSAGVAATELREALEI